MAGNAVEKRMSDKLVSVVINNYNYGRYVCSAIDSALQQSYEPVEIVVVDDGSKDDSRALIARYGRRIKAVFKDNGGQASAYNAGFAACQGDIVVFLDADDTLYRDAARHAVSAFTDDRVAKAQFRLEIVDDEGKGSGIHIPAGRMPNGDVLGMLLKYGSYGSPPASGNVYRRRVLTPVLPMPESTWRIAADSVPALAAPFFGDVVSIDRVLGCYRVHNSGAAKRASAAARPGNSESLCDKVEAFLKSERYLDELCARHGKRMGPNIIERNPSMLKTMLCFKISEPDHALNRGYGVAGLAVAGADASLKYPLYSAFPKLAMALWFLLVAACPPVRKMLIPWGLQPWLRGVKLS